MCIMSPWEGNFENGCSDRNSSQEGHGPNGTEAGGTQFLCYKRQKDVGKNPTLEHGSFSQKH